MFEQMKATRRIVFCFVLCSANLLYAEEIDEADIFNLPEFEVSVYVADVPVYDGFTNEEYTGKNATVWGFAQSFNELLLAFHKKLVIDELKHMNYRLSQREKFENELNSLFLSLGFEGFKIERDLVLSRELSIVNRLIKEPFFKVDKLIVWDLELLNAMAPEKPKLKYAKDIHYNTELDKWERRVTTKWEVIFQRPNARRVFMTDKQQGLNLDTLKGFHFIERGLPARIPSHAFKEVNLTYPMFYSAKQPHEAQLEYLKNTLIANLIYIYDPFSWVARRSTRFRGGFYPTIHEFVGKQTIYVKDRKWFDQAFARFLADVATIKFQGLGEILNLQLENQYLHHSPRTLGTDLDLLNWNRGEKRKAKHEPITNNIYVGGFRYTMIAAYMRYQDALLEKIVTRLIEQKEKRERVNGQQMLKEIVEELSQKDFESFAQSSKLAMDKAVESLLAEENDS